MPDKIYSLNVEPGIQRDGTVFSSRGWTDGRWVRFQRGLPRKIGGYTELASSPEIARGMYVVPDAPNFDVIYGTASHLYSLKIGPDPTNPTVLAAPVERTPVAFDANGNNEWQFDNMFSAASGTQMFVAHAAQNLFSIANTQDRPIYYGDLNSNAPLVSNGISVSGGIIVLHPFLFAFGNDGEIIWFQPNNATEVRGSAIVTGDKILAGLPVRGGTSSPAGLFWSLSSVIRATFTGNSNDDFNFDTISGESSILSSNSIIEFDNLYYWLSSDRILVYNGTVQELPNDKNINYFFDNLNYSQRQKVWATKVTRFGEIWWHYPRGNSVECNAALIHNVRERTWYDTSYDLNFIDGRSSGYFDQTYSKPIWSGTTVDDQGHYPIYIHEVGTNKVFSDGTQSPISASIKTSSLSFVATAPNGGRPETDVNLYLSRIEPDFIINGSMEVSISTRQYAQADEIVDSTRTIDSTTKKLDFTTMGREIYIQFDCTALNCDFQMGQILVVGKLGDMRP